MLEPTTRKLEAVRLLAVSPVFVSVSPPAGLVKWSLDPKVEIKQQRKWARNWGESVDRSAVRPAELEVALEFDGCDAPCCYRRQSLGVSSETGCCFGNKHSLKDKSLLSAQAKLKTRAGSCSERSQKGPA